MLQSIHPESKRETLAVLSERIWLAPLQDGPADPPNGTAEKHQGDDPVDRAHGAILAETPLHSPGSGKLFAVVLVLGLAIV